MHWSQAPSIFKHHTPWPTRYASTPLGGRGRQPVAAQRLMQGEQNSWKPRRKQGPHVTTGIWKFNLCAVGCAQNYSFRSCCHCLIHDWYVHVYDIIQNFHSFIDRLTRCKWHLYITHWDVASVSWDPVVENNDHWQREPWPLNLQFHPELQPRCTKINQKAQCA